MEAAKHRRQNRTFEVYSIHAHNRNAAHTVIVMCTPAAALSRERGCHSIDCTPRALPLSKPRICSLLLTVDGAWCKAIGYSPSYGTNQLHVRRKYSICLARLVSCTNKIVNTTSESSNPTGNTLLKNKTPQPITLLLQHPTHQSPSLSRKRALKYHTQNPYILRALVHTKKNSN